MRRLVILLALLGCAEEQVVANATVLQVKKNTFHGNWQAEVSLPSGQRTTIYRYWEMKVGDTLAIEVPRSKMAYPEALCPR